MEESKALVLSTVLRAHLIRPKQHSSGRQKMHQRVLPPCLLHRDRATETATERQLLRGRSGADGLQILPP